MLLVVKYSVDILHRFCEAERAIPILLTEAQRSEFLERTVGISKDQIRELQEYAETSGFPLFEVFKPEVNDPRKYSRCIGSA